MMIPKLFQAFSDRYRPLRTCGCEKPTGSKLLYKQLHRAQEQSAVRHFGVKPGPLEFLEKWWGMRRTVSDMPQAPMVSEGVL